MFKKFTIAVKENKNQIRRKLLVTGGVVAGTVVAGIVIHKLNLQQSEIEELATATGDIIDTVDTIID